MKTTDFPILMFPKPAPADRTKRKRGASEPHKPEAKENYQRMAPRLEELQEVIRKMDMQIQSGAEGVEPESVLNVISSAVGSLTNSEKLEDTFTSSGTGKLSVFTIKQYLDYLCDAFMIEQAERYDIKGKRYISTPYKYYFTDTWLGNARLNFRQLEETHLMEYVMYNELCQRGYSVDVGVVEINERQEDGKCKKKTRFLHIWFKFCTNRFRDYI